MNAFTKHIDFATLAELSEQRLAAENAKPLLAHLADCSRCSAELLQLESVTQLMTNDTSTDAPRDVTQYALSIFRHRAQAKEPSLLQRIAAVLTFDSRTSTPAFGFRSGVSSTRQMLYSAGAHDIDLRVTPEGESWIIAGQVLGQDCAGGEVVLKSESSTSSVALNDLCEFRLPAVSSGDYTLCLRLANLEVVIPRLELRA